MSRRYPARRALSIIPESLNSVAGGTILNFSEYLALQPALDDAGGQTPRCACLSQRPSGEPSPSSGWEGSRRPTSAVAAIALPRNASPLRRGLYLTSRSRSLVEIFMAARGMAIAGETARRRAVTFGQDFTDRSRQGAAKLAGRRGPDEVVVGVNGTSRALGRAVDPDCRGRNALFGAVVAGPPGQSPRGG